MSAVKHQPEQPLRDLLAGLSQKQLALTPMCDDCGWRKGGLDSWNGRACKCGNMSPTFGELIRNGWEGP